MENLHSFSDPRRKRVQIDCSTPDPTDKSDKAKCDINNIMKIYAKTGLLPNVQEKIARFVDNTQIIPLEEAYERVNEAKALFYDLPVQVRQLMEHDPKQMEAFIADPENEAILLKHGVLIKKTDLTDLAAKVQTEAPKAPEVPKTPV